MNNPQVFLFPILIATAVGIRILAGKLDRERICEHVERSGGKVIDICWNPLGRGWFGSRNERIYDVQYRTRHGKIVQATCKTSMLSGVYWTSDSAPADFMETPEAEDDCTEPTQCLGCGSTIRARVTRCPKCGWSYKDA